MLFSIAGTRRLEIGYLGGGGIGFHVFFRDRLASSPFQLANARFVTDDDLSALEQRFASPFRRRRSGSGRSVVASNTASLPEPAAALFADPKSPRAVGSPRSNASVPNQTLHAICARRVPKPGIFHGKQAPRLIGPHHVAFPRRRAGTKARLTLPCNPRKLYMVERPLNRQEPRRGSS